MAEVMKLIFCALCWYANFHQQCGSLIGPNHSQIPPHIYLIENQGGEQQGLGAEVSSNAPHIPFKAVKLSVSNIKENIAYIKRPTGVQPSKGMFSCTRLIFYTVF